MGNESSGFQNVTLGEEHRIDGKQGWTLHSATRKDGDTVSVFVYKKDKPFREYVDNAVKNLKVLRHPGIVKFLSLRTTSDADLLITEHVRPLMEVIDTMTPGEISVGLYSILEALSFLHEMGRSCHNNVCLSAIFVNDDGNWLLGAVEFVCRFDAATDQYLQKCRNMRNQAAIPPEEKAGRTEPTPEYGTARDAYGFGVLAEQLLEYLISDTPDAAADIDAASSKTFELRVQDECMNPEPSQRPQLSSLLQDRLFKADFVDISNFLKQITLKSEEEKQEFFSGVVEKLHSVPVTVLATRLARPLLARFVLLDATAEEKLMPHLLTPYTGANRPPYHPGAPCCPLLPTSLFRKHVLPELFKIFHVRDAHIRKVLLKYFPCYVAQFDGETLGDAILPQIVLGLRDADDELVSASLHALGDLVTLIGADTVIGQGRSRVFSIGKPKFINKSNVKEERNGTVAARKGSPLKPAAEVESEPVEKKRTLREIAREAERQKQRSEARQKAKERQKKREEEKAKIKRIEKTEEQITVAMSDTTPNVNPATPEHSNPDSQSKPSIANSQSEAPTGSNQSETPIQSDSEGDNWEGWEEEEEEEEEEHTEQSIDSEIDREIEQELVKMDPVPTSTTTSTKSQSFQPWSGSDPAPPITTTTGKGRMKLSEKTRTSPPPQSPVESSSDTKSPNRKHVAKPLELKKDKAKAITEKKVPKKLNSGPLGAEYDIKALDIKAGGLSEEPDFFADMAPVIKKTSGVLDIIEGGSVEKTPEKKSAVLAYNVQETEDAAADGWGDDFGDDWGDE